MSKKINPKVIALALTILTFLAAGGIAAKETLADRGGGGFEPDPDPNGG
jgi:hypothetical protein